ncbi:GAB1 [Bugula neritina]|uniref:GAB1 n=1 Tax=Bugula neritina TaxID=10212 RepID=A0A7J7JLP5_BUGNE|nr:GAB1 [Bugula neritina]
MEDILCGWLTKSPGDKFVTFLKGKVHIPVKAKWRRRFFRLYRPSPLFPNRYKLSYYKDDSLQNKLGSINLAQCEKIESSLDTAYYQHLFAIQVSSQNNRLYYLAADTEEAMLKWVECLCRICNLHQECRQSDNNSTSEEKIFKGPSTSSAITEVSREAEAKGYVHLSQCYTAPDSAMYDDYDVPPTLTSPPVGWRLLRPDYET